MAGAFGDDYGLNYHDDEDDIVEQDSQNENDVIDQEDIVDENENLAEEQANNRALNNKMDKLAKDIQKRFLPRLTPEEQKLIDKAKASKQTAQVNKVKRSHKKAKESFWNKVKAGISTFGPFLLVLFFVFIAIICFLAVLSEMGLISFDDDKNSGNKNAQFGVNGSDFYGTRVIYKDNEQSRIELVDSYAELIADVVLSIESTTVENATLDVTLISPSEDYDYSNLADYQANYANHYDLIKSIAETVHDYDKLDAEATPTDLITLLDNTAHFGFSNEMITSIATKIKEYLNNNNLVSVVPAESGNETTIANAELVNTAVDSVINAITPMQTEKYFIKDYLFDTAEDMMQGITKENYVAMIFMSKNPVTFNYFSFYVDDIDDNFSIKVVNGEQKINFTKLEFMTIDGKTTWEYKSSENLTVSTDSYTNLGDLDLSSAKSLYEISASSVDNTKYVVANDNGIYTYLTDGVYVEFNNNTEFGFVENETKWN